jgi:hypothetical protein
MDIAFFSTFGLCIFKEVLDRKTTGFNFWDLTAGFLGLMSWLLFH